VGCDISIGSTACEALAKAYEVDADDVEVEIRKFRNGTIKALICIEGECNLYDVCEEVGGGGWVWLSPALRCLIPWRLGSGFITRILRQFCSVSEATLGSGAGRAGEKR